MIIGKYRQSRYKREELDMAIRKVGGPSGVPSYNRPSPVPKQLLSLKNRVMNVVTNVFLAPRKRTKSKMGTEITDDTEKASSVAYRTMYTEKT